MADISKRHELSCGACGESGYLSLTRGDDSDWSFACYGFVGLAVDHFNLGNSVFRCNSCRSLRVSVDPDS